MLAVDLIAALEDAVLSVGEDVEVRFASQPNWPFEYSISQWATIEPVELEGGEQVVYLAEGTQLGYLPSEARDSIGW